MRRLLPCVLLLFVLAAGCARDSATSSTTETTEGADSTTTGAETSSTSDETGSTTTRSETELKAADLCDAIPDDIVRAILGDVPKGEAAGMLGVKSCTWEVDENTRLAVTVGAKSTYQAALDAMGKVKIEDVAGIGDSAFVAPGFTSSTSGGSQGTTLFVVEGDQVYIVSVELPDGEVGTQTLVEVGSKLLDEAG